MHPRCYKCRPRSIQCILISSQFLFCTVPLDKFRETTWNIPDATSTQYSMMYGTVLHTLPNTGLQLCSRIPGYMTHPVGKSQCSCKVEKCNSFFNENRIWQGTFLYHHPYLVHCITIKFLQRFVFHSTRTVYSEDHLHFCYQNMMQVYHHFKKKYLKNLAKFDSAVLMTLS